jgi:acyl carrier protein
MVPAGKTCPTVTAIRHALRKKLPDYMIPSGFVVLDALPLSPNGKVDRQALPDPGRSRPELDTPYLAARTPTDEQLAKIWAEVLSLDRVGIHDDFFELGGHSLAAIRVVSQVLKQFRIELPLQLLFQSPTVAAMAAVITEHQAKKLGNGKLKRILAELESLSDEEAQRLVGNEPAAGRR